MPTLNHFHMLILLSLFSSLFGCSTAPVKFQNAETNAMTFQVSSLLTQLKSFDTDRDTKITVLDTVSFPSILTNSQGETLQINGIYPLSIAWQETALAIEAKQSEVTLDKNKLTQKPLKRARDLISKYYWDNLTRRLDKEGVLAMIDSKTNNAGLHIYVPNSDSVQFNYYRKLLPYWRSQNVRVYLHRLPQKITAGFVRNLDGQHGILALGYRQMGNGSIEPLPFVVPGGRFNEMYGWDSYFIALGLIESGKIELAKAMVDNFVYQTNHYGKILNANRSYYLTRSQPPFTTSMIRAVYEKLPNNQESREWVAGAMRAALKEYNKVWMSPPRRDAVTGLSRYYAEGLGPCPEVERGHYNEALVSFVGDKQFPQAKNVQELIDIITNSFQKNPKFKIQNKQLADFFLHDRTMRESGHDTTFRWHDKAADYATVDLNSLLFKYEQDFLDLVQEGVLSSEEFGIAEYWRNARNSRRLAMFKHMHEPTSGLFYDYNLAEKKRSDFLSATVFYTLWAGIVDQTQARKLTRSALLELEQPGGLASTSLSSLKKYGYPPGQRQWDYPNGWAPHQILAWKGLEQMGFPGDAGRLKQTWTEMLAKGISDYNGTIPEKYDVANRSHKVFAEYGNVGTDFSYITKEGFGWMNTSILLGLKK
ncbi:MAG: trehalase [Bdellovibrionales bacterium CG10_big_fil_rev_8_21_14_0_10_45_34]|nr:MAG: trehalase [Bdellovibrionales bacterium CG10_big_fil_rev_8_21_14_0_10_45_34]